MSLDRKGCRVLVQHSWEDWIQSVFSLMISLRCRFGVLPVVFNLVLLLLDISLALSYFSFKSLEAELKLKGFYFFIGLT